MGAYKDLVERLSKETYWSGSSGPGSRDIHPAICDEAADAIAELMARAESAERQRDEAMADLEATRAALAEAHGLVGVTPKTMFGVPLARLHQLAEADKAGSILGALDMAKVACALQELNKYKELGGLDYLRELVEAERDGRCAVLPCKPGDTVWMITKRGIRRVERWTVYRVYKRDVGDWYFVLKNMMLSQIRPNEFEECTRAISSFGKTVFTTLEAAEQAMEVEKMGQEEYNGVG